jgi:CRP/FNR family cyclic AMP-dependent transcriptional regulator
MEWKLLAGVPEDQARELVAVARRRRFARGEVVFHEGDPADSLQLVIRGRFAVRRSTPLGDVAILAVRGPGEAFGELALLGEATQRSATIEALESAETYAVARSDFERLRHRRPEVADVLLALLASDVRRMNDRLLEAFYLPAERRIRRRVLEIAAMYGDEPPITVPLTQEELAALAGTARATVNRVLREEQVRGTLELRRGRTVVLDPDALARRAR